MYTVHMRYFYAFISHLLVVKWPLFALVSMGRWVISADEYVYVCVCVCARACICACVRVSAFFLADSSTAVLRIDLARSPDVLKRAREGSSRPPVTY